MIFWIVIFILFLILATRGEGQTIPEDALNYSYYDNGKQLSIGDEPILYIFGKGAFGFKDGGLQAIAANGDTLYITIKKKDF